MLPSSKQETADGIYGSRRSVSVKLIAYLLIFLSWQLFFPSPPTPQTWSLYAETSSQLNQNKWLANV